MRGAVQKRPKEARRRDLVADLRADVHRRLERLRGEIEARKLDAVLITKEVNVRYLSGFTGSDSVLLVGARGGKGGLILVTDFRYEEEASESAPRARVVLRKKGLMAEAARLARKRGWMRLGYELAGILAADRDDLAREARAGKGPRPGLRPTRNLVESLRAVKSPAEVAAIARAVGLAERAGRVVRRFLREGRAEIEIARRVARSMEDSGAAGLAFPVIAALDARGALPHAKPGDVAAKKRSVLLLDWGARFEFYCSDLTRVFALNSIPSWLREAHEAVLEAQRAAMGRIGPGARAEDVDAAAREVIRKAGLGRRFGHGAGHGLGLEVHEAPRLGPGSRDVLRAGMVVTVEPGVYFPGRGGVRIEDDVVVTDSGAEGLSRLPRELR